MKIREMIRFVARLFATAIWYIMVLPFYVYHYIKQRAWELPR